MALMANSHTPLPDWKEADHMPRTILCIAPLLALSVSGFAAETLLFVSPEGNDAWSGRLPAADERGADGPFATLAKARDTIRALRERGAITGSVTVQIRAGQYFLDEPFSLGPADSGTADAPITYMAYPGEKPVLVGGKPITGFEAQADGVLVADLPEVREGGWRFRSLFADGRRMIPARTPNFDPSDPYRKGFSYVALDPNAFGYSVGNIHNPGDWMEYDVEVPSDGEYTLWVYYGAQNKPFGNDNMAGRTAVKIDGGEFTPLMNLPDTGGWAVTSWQPTATLQLTAGRHVLHWENLKGGGLNLASFALSNDPDWRPVDTNLPPVADGRHMILIQAARFKKYKGIQLTVSGSGMGSKTSFTYAPGDIKPEWARIPGAEVHIFQSGNCRAFHEVLSIESVDEAKHLVTVGGPEASSTLATGDRYFVQNVPDALDAPGEWYLDAEKGQLRFIPPAGFGEGSLVVAPVAGRIVELVGDADRPVSHVRFRGLTFTGGEYDQNDGAVGYGMGTNGVVFLGKATDCEVADCTFVSIGKHAVCCSGGGRHAITGNDISRTAYGGVMLLDSAGNLVADNHIHHTGEVYKHPGGIAMQGAKASDNVVRRNAIHDTSRYGISFKYAGTNNLVEDNFIQNTNLETYDTGGIEVTQGDREGRSGSIIQRNFVADTIGYSCQHDKSLFLSWSIYLDSFAGGYTVRDNICPRSNNGGIMFQGGKDNIVTNNILIDGRVGQGHWSNFAGNSTGLVFERNIVAWSNPDATLWAHGKLGPEVIRSDRNLFWCPGIPEPKLGYGGRDAWADWQAQGYDQNSLFSDPLFVDPANDDFALRADSPAWQLGFEKIDTSGIQAAKAHCNCEIEPAAELFFAQ